MKNLPFAALLYASFFVFKSQGYIGVQHVDTDKGFCLLDNGTNLSLGEYTIDKDKCEKISCEPGIIKTVGCSPVAFQPKPGFVCDLIRSGDDFPDCCPSILNCTQIFEEPLELDLKSVTDELSNISDSQLETSPFISTPTPKSGNSLAEFHVNVNKTFHQEFPLEITEDYSDSPNRSELIATSTPLAILLNSSKLISTLHDRENSMTNLSFNKYRTESDMFDSQARTTSFVSTTPPTPTPKNGDTLVELSVTVQSVNATLLDELPLEITEVSSNSSSGSE